MSRSPVLTEEYHIARFMEQALQLKPGKPREVFMIPGELSDPIQPDDHCLGPDDAAVTLVDYGDFECPYCAEANSVIGRIREVYGDQVRFVFRHFPLTASHEYAFLAAQASEAAAAQGKFWPMYEQLFLNQEDLRPAALLRYATRIGLDLHRFQVELDEGRYIRRVEHDMRSGMRNSVNHTPTLFINGRLYDGEIDFDQLSEAVEVELEILDAMGERGAA